MGSEWIEGTLADACESIDYGLTASASDQPVGPKFLRITDIASGHVDWKAVPYVFADAATTAKYRLHDGDIVLARTGASTGASAYVKNPPPAVFASYLVRLQAKSSFDPRYLAYYLKCDAFWTFIRGVLGDKSAQPNASASTMTKAPLRAPRNKNEQSAIAHILGAFDDKIELNRRMSETLEGIARAIFKSWFVDFDPVRAKMEGRDPGLAPEIAALFPDRLVETDKGEIPEGWESRAISELADLNPESWSRADYPSQVEYVDLANTKWGEISDVQMFERADAPSRAQRVLRPGDTIVGTVRPGNGAYALIGREGLTGSTGFAVLRPKRKTDREFIYLAATQRSVIDHLAHLADGAAYPAVRPQVVAGVETTLADPDVRSAFSQITGPLLDRIELNRFQSGTLAALRDLLLPKLMSGEIRIRDAEKLLGEAGV